MYKSLQPHGLQHARGPLSITNSQSLLKLMSIQPVMPCKHLILCCPLLLLPSIFPSIRVFSNESVFHIRWPKYWSFSFNISSSSEYSGLISFRMDWLDLLAVQGTDSQESSPTPQFKSISSSAFGFLYSPTLTYMTTGKTIALTRQAFVGKVMSLLFNMLSWRRQWHPPSSTVAWKIPWMEEPGRLQSMGLLRVGHD